jgi:hypothetical protein
MTTRKSGLLGLILGVALLAACDPKNVIEVPPQPVDTTRVITLNLVPETATLTAVGQTVTLVAVVSGTTTQTATFTSSNTSVATVNSSTGVVTAVGNGTAVITAVSTADNTARDGSTITVQIGQPGPGTVATVSIQSITQGGTLFPVNQQNIQGQIDVTVNADIPAGSNVTRLEVLVDQTVACTQNFTTTGTGSDLSVDGSQIPVSVICSINTAAFNATTGAVTYANGVHRISARLVTTTGTIAATVAQDLTFNNQNFIATNNLNLAAAFSRGCTTSTNVPGPGNLAPVGSLWCGGDLTINLLNVNFGPSTNAIASYTVSITTSGAGSNGICAGVAVAPAVTPNCAVTTMAATSTTGTVTFTGGSTNTATANDISGVEDIVAITVTSVTTGGQAGPVCINPNPATNPAGACGTGFGGSLPNVAFFTNPVRIDNLAPRPTLFDITPATLGCAQAACYVNGAFTFSERAGFFTTVDYGVDGQTATFAAGPSSGSLTTVTNGSQLAETQTSQTLFLQATTTDRLQNSRAVFAGPTAATPLTSTTGAQQFGVDLTAPTAAFVAPSAPNNGANDGNTWTISFSDAGVGPSGFAANPVRVRLERILATGTVCLNPDTGATVSCTTNGGFVADDGSVTIPATPGYYRIRATATDEAGNNSTEITRLTLIDLVPPTTGGVVAPSTITGGTSATFSASVQDNVDLGDVQAAVNYGAVTLGFPRVTIDAYGPESFTVSTNAAVTIDNFIRGIETTTAAGRPTGVTTSAQTIQFDVRDAAGVVDNVACPGNATNCVSSPAQNIAPNVAAGGAATSVTTGTGATANNFNSANALHGNFLMSAPSPATVCNNNGGAAGCPTNPTSTTLSATVTGPNSVFANPFSRVNFYYIDALGRAQLIGTGSISVTDNTVTSTRTYTYTVVWTPGTAIPAGATQVFALGVDAEGDALMTNQQTVTVAVD